MTTDAPRFIILDLADVTDAMGAHWNSLHRDEYTTACPVCYEQVGQDVNECPYCNTPIIWRHSKLWRRMYGNPSATERLLSIYPPDPDDVVGQELMRVSRTTGFANLTEKARWDKCRRHLDTDYLRNIIGYCERKTTNPGADRCPRSRRGIVVFSLNVAEKAVRDRKIPKQRVVGPQEVVV